MPAEKRFAGFFMPRDAGRNAGRVRVSLLRLVGMPIVPFHGRKDSR